MRLSILIILVFLFSACSGTSNNGNKPANVGNVNKTNSNSPTTSGAPVLYDYEVVNTYPHDPSAFTQGLVFHDGFFYEGTGGRKDDTFHSSLRKVEVETGKVVKKFDLAGDYFGEGITIFNDKIYEITWQENTAFQYDLNDFKLLKEFRYSGEGWGITHDGTSLIMSDGTHVIRFINPENFETIRTIVVNDEKGKPLMMLNELEYVKGEIWANVWQQDWIARIDPSNGKLLGRIDITKLAEEQMNADRSADVLNGIAYDPAADRIFVTGKKWKKLFEIKVKPKQ